MNLTRVNRLIRDLGSLYASALHARYWRPFLPGFRLADMLIEIVWTD